MKTSCGPTVVVRQHRSKLLERNALGDPATRQVVIILPPSYENAGRRFPTIYWLAGFGSRGAGFLNDSPLAPSLPERLRRLMVSGAVPEAIVVLPDCSTRYGGSQYIDSEGTGPYQSYLIEELVPFVDEEYLTIAEPAARAIVGRSSGGFGALLLAMRRPDTFQIVGCNSPDCGFEYCYWPFLPRVLNTFEARGGYQRFVKDPHGVVPKDAEYMLALSFVAMAACYSPCSRNPEGFDFLCDPETGEINDEVWARWLDYDPVRLAPQYADVLRSLRMLYIDVGRRDEYHMSWGVRMLHARLEQLKIPHAYEEHEGGHQGIDHRYDVMLTALARALPP